MTFPEGNGIASTYDSTVNPWAHNLAAITRAPQPSSPLVATTTNDGFDRLVQTTYASGTALASSESYGYDADDNVTTRTTRKGDPIIFAYDTLNRLITKTPPSHRPRW